MVVVVVVVAAAAAAVVVLVVAVVVVVVVVLVVVVVVLVAVLVVKVKVIPQYAMKAQREERCIVLPIYNIHNLGARRVNTTPRPHYTKETEPIPITQEPEWVSGPELTGALLFFSFLPSFNLVLVYLFLPSYL